MRPTTADINITPFIEHSTDLAQTPVKFFDTTLRDGEQGAGGGMTPKVKIMLAGIIQSTGMDRMELGFAASGEDYDTIRELATGLFADKFTQVCALARANKGDIDAVVSALEGAKNPFIHTFISTSKLHREQKLGLNKAGVVGKIIESIMHAKEQSGGWTVEWSAEDASRTELPFLIECVRTAINAGADIINLPDTVGHGNWEHYGWMFEQVIKNVQVEIKAAEATGKTIEFSAHCHDDHGTATASSISPVKHGARQVEGCLQGGERAGNVQLEQVAAYLDSHGGLMMPNTQFVHSLNSKLLVPARMAVARATGMPIPFKQPISGKDAAAHGAGIHTDGAEKGDVPAGEGSIYNYVDVEAYGARPPEATIGSRAGGADIVKALAHFGIKEGKRSNAITGVVGHCTRRSAELHGVSQSEAVWAYSQQVEGLTFIDGEVEDKSAHWDILFEGESFKISGETSVEYGLVGTFIKAINKRFDLDLQILDQSENRKYSIPEIEALWHDESGQEDDKFLQLDSSGDEAQAICEVIVLNSTTGQTSIGKSLSARVTTGNLEALKTAVWPFVRQSIKEDKLT